MSGQLVGLVVDDNEQIRELFARALGRAGIQVIRAESGLVALRLAHDLGTALRFVVTDIEMPHMDGLELCRQLRQLSATASIPIVAVTAAAAQADEAAAAGCDVILPKPCSAELLLATIRGLLVKQSGSLRKQ
jgi:CheY-like chemotaxis protein